MNRNINVHVLRMTDLGCQRRGLDAKRLLAYFRQNGCSIISEPSKADYIVFITCAFRQEKEDDCFRMLTKLKKHKAELIVMGCLPGIAPDRLKSEFNGTSIATSEMEQIDLIFPDFEIKFADIPDANQPNKSTLVSKTAVSKFLSEFEISREFFYKVVDYVKPVWEEDKAKKVFLRISNGCLGNCAYCAIRYGTGTLKSKAIDKIVAEYKNLVDQGHKYIVITAEDTGAYGLDIGLSFPDLMNELLKIQVPEDIQFGIVAFQPRWAIKYQDELVDILKSGKIKVLYCPMQAGSSRILKLMCRYYEKEEMVRTMKVMKNAYPDLILCTHVIIGFPTETEEDYNDTLDVLKSVDFNLARIFYYTDRERTDSVPFQPKIERKIMLDRYKKTLEFVKKEGLKTEIRIN